MSANLIRSQMLRQGVMGLRRHMATAIPAFATVNPFTASGASPGVMQNLVNGTWVDTSQTRRVIDPMNGEGFLICPDTDKSELRPFLQSMEAVPRHGMHNMYYRPERFMMYGDVYRKAAEIMRDPVVTRFLVKLIQRVMPKSETQALGEVVVTRRFLENFSGDNIRLLMRGFVQAGDHTGQRSIGYRWPYGPVAVISPFNFPLEIPILQYCAAAMVGNKPLIKPESHVGLVSEQFLRLLHHCGLPKEEMDLIHCSGSVMNELLLTGVFRTTQFTGGQTGAHQVQTTTRGKVKIEDAGFDWKVLGPMNLLESPAQQKRLLDYTAWQCDQDAYAISGQKCSAQSIALVHQDWIKAGFLERIEALAARRSLKDLTLSPLLSHTTKEVQDHVQRILQIPGSRLLFGGKPLTGHTIPEEFGAFEPTAILVDINEIVKPEHYPAATTELFGPVQLIAPWNSDQETLVAHYLKNMEALLTAAIVSHDPEFINRILSVTSNGTTYAGIRARTTGAPQNHWFGPAGSPLCAGIGSPEAVLQTWTCHREIVYDEGPIPVQWETPPPS